MYTSKQQGDDINAIYMIKIKIDHQSTSCFVKVPDIIQDPVHATIQANIDSINDKICVEFYDVIKEDGFDIISAYKNPSNFRLLSFKIFDVRDLPFDPEG